ncbi:hypothetical protein FHU33_4592 [Blastococcus colisei]|uniref:Uncharacterized protein n=1 Tax=Blastococcus colisei TaxID=1564162 RepID=A0A543P1H1_9ACTN|nr:hypothetical protein [Blastococcus colisei]TQN37919.1 hypothetical protein FHU33_4592 [Blastococcus colisei]
MSDLAGSRADLSAVRRVSAPDVVVSAAGGREVRLLLVTEWLDSMSFHLSWPWLLDDVHASVRQAYRLEDASGQSLPLLDSRVMPLAGRMNEVTYFDTQGLDRSQILELRLRCRLPEPLEVPFGG